MAHRRPLHALEKWAYDAASIVPGEGQTKTNLIINTALLDMVVHAQHDPSENAMLQIQGTLGQMIFAADCLSGRAQIVRIPEEVYDDVCKSELANDANADINQTDRYPWPMFAIELNNCKSHLAVVVSSLEYLRSRAKDAQRVLGIKDSMLEDLTNLLQVDHDENDGRDYSTIMTFIPTPETCKQSFDAMLDAILGDEPIVGHGIMEIDPVALALSKLDTMPYFIWGDADSDTPSMDEILNIVAFVMADNVERTKVYEPSTEPLSYSKRKKKRKQCQAHIYEAGVSWSKAYKAYREAMKSGNHGGHKRPHIRRGHFHRFRVGPRDGEVRYVTYWLPPKLVGDTSKYKPSNQGHIIG